MLQRRVQQGTPFESGWCPRKQNNWDPIYNFGIAVRDVMSPSTCGMWVFACRVEVVAFNATVEARRRAVYYVVEIGQFVVRRQVLFLMTKYISTGR